MLDTGDAANWGINDHFHAIVVFDFSVSGV
jgi:hypothetical protein